MQLASDHGVRPSSAPSEEVLWRRGLGGDGEAFGVVFDRHRDRVFGHARRMAPTQHDAEDIAAAAFLELWRRRAEVRLIDGSVLYESDGRTPVDRFVVGR